MIVYGLKATMWMYGEPQMRYSHKLFTSRTKAELDIPAFVNELNDTFAPTVDDLLEPHDVYVTEFELED